MTSKIINTKGESLLNFVYIHLLHILKVICLPSQVLFLQHNSRIHTTSSYFQWKVNANAFSFCTGGYTRLAQNQQSRQCYFNYSIAYVQLHGGSLEHINLQQGCKDLKKVTKSLL